MCTSSSTTSGSLARGSAPRPRPRWQRRLRSRRRPLSSARTPARKSWWSSTITTRGALTRVALEHQLHLGAAAGRAVDLAPGRRGAPCGPRSTRARRACRPARWPGRTRPRGRARTPATRPSLTSAYTSTVPPPPNLAALTIASRAAATSAWPRSLSAQSPTATTSTSTRCCCSTSAAAASSARQPGGRRRLVRPASQWRSSRSCRRASAATSRVVGAFFCTSASVCSTESCRWAAISARSCERMRSLRSAASERARRSTQGAKITPSTTATTSTARTTSRAALSAPVAWRNTMPAAITSATPKPAARHERGTARASSSGVSASAGDRSAPAPDDWCQSSAAPPLTSTSGHTTASENQKPAARAASRTLRSRSPTPTATSIDARRSRSGAPGSEGISTQQSR